MQTLRTQAGLSANRSSSNSQPRSLDKDFKASPYEITNIKLDNLTNQNFGMTNSNLDQDAQPIVRQPPLVPRIKSAKVQDFKIRGGGVRKVHSKLLANTLRKPSVPDYMSTPKGISIKFQRTGFSKRKQSYDREQRYDQQLIHLIGFDKPLLAASVESCTDEGAEGIPEEPFPIEDAETPPVMEDQAAEKNVARP